MPPGRGPGRRHPPRALPAAAALPGTGASPGTAARRRLPSGPEAAGGGGALALSGGVRAGGCNERVACSGRATSRGLSDVGLEVALELRFKPRRPKHRYPDLRSRLTASRLRPPESRSNVGCVPPTAKAAAPFSKATWAAGCCPPPASQVPSEPGESLRPPEITSDAEGDPWKLRAWIEERKQLRYQLESIVDVEKWLMGKPSLSSQEERVWERIKACRADRRAESKSALTRSLACSPPASCQPWQEGRLPLIRAPYPPALVTLHNLLRKQKLTMVDVFKRAGMDRRKITRADFIHIIKATKVPISDKDLETVIIFLASSKRGDFISNEDLIECQKQWLEMMKGQSRETKTAVQAQFHKTTCTTVSCVTSAGSKAKEMKPRAPTKPETPLMLVEVPPVNTEPECRYLSYDEMEETGKQFRDRKRWRKNKAC